MDLDVLLSKALDKSIEISGRKYIKRTDLASVLDVHPERLKSLFKRHAELRKFTRIENVRGGLKVCYVDIEHLDKVIGKLFRNNTERHVQEQEDTTLTKSSCNGLYACLHVIDALLIVLEHECTSDKAISTIKLLKKRFSELVRILKFDTCDFNFISQKSKGGWNV